MALYASLSTPLSRTVATALPRGRLLTWDGIRFAGFFEMFQVWICSGPGRLQDQLLLVSQMISAARREARLQLLAPSRISGDVLAVDGDFHAHTA
jgi:hypothetical protein